MCYKLKMITMKAISMSQPKSKSSRKVNPLAELAEDANVVIVHPSLTKKITPPGRSNLAPPPPPEPTDDERVRIIDPSKAKILDPFAEKPKRRPATGVAITKQQVVAITPAQVTYVPVPTPEPAPQVKTQVAQVAETFMTSHAVVIPTHDTGRWDISPSNPIVIIASGKLYGISASSGSGLIFICKNVPADATFSSTEEYVIAAINLDAGCPTLLPGEITGGSSWNSKSVEVQRNDKLSVYSSRATDANIKLHVLHR
jgi:hypothetical protein